MAANLDFVTLVVLVLSFISWLVAMAGVAAAQADGASASTVGYAWWAVWYQFFLLIFVGLAACIGSLQANRLRTYLMLMATVVWMEVANTARIWVDGGLTGGAAANLFGAIGGTGDLKTDAQAVLAGAILTLIFNFVLIIYWGLTEHGSQGLSLRKQTDAAPAPTTTSVDPLPLPTKGDTVVAAV